MPRLDDCHPQIVRALEKDGWKVQDAPFRIVLSKRRVIYIDVEASRGTNGSRQQILLAEIKCFPESQNTITELYHAIGQYLIYQSVLIMANLTISLYLAIPETIYEAIFDEAVRHAISQSKIKLLIVDMDEERVKQWIE